LFGKPDINGSRRLGVALSRGETIEMAKRRAIEASDAIVIHYD